MMQAASRTRVLPVIVSLCLSTMCQCEVRYMHNIEQGTACGHARQGLTAIHGKGITPSVVSAPANGVSLSPVCSIALGAACKQY